MAGKELVPYGYQVGGSLPPSAPTYVCRDADNQLFEALQRRQFCYILNARQSGKSSLRVRTMQRLQADEICCGVLDMTMLGTQHLQPSQWYASIVRRLIRVFKLSTNFRQWWSERMDLSPVQCLAEFFDEELLGQIEQPIILFIDEIDSTLQLDFSADDFFALIRACYNNRADDPKYNRLTFVLIGVAIPSDLISDPVTTPFNIGQAIALHGFQRPEADTLLTGFPEALPNKQSVLDEILEWTGGQPFLTQKVCQMIGATWTASAESTETMAADSHPLKVGQLIYTQLIDNWEAQDQPEHLKTIRDRLFANPLLTAGLLGLYQQLLNGEVIATGESLTQITLRLSGLVVDKQGHLAIANPIYQAVFNSAWVEEQLANLRPYGIALKAWTDGNCEGDEYLLEGLVLKEALAWAESKRLGDLDYRFLSASQDVAQQAMESDLAHEIEERERAEFALNSATEAIALLAQTRQDVRSHISHFRQRKLLLAGLTLGVSVLVGLVRLLGGIEGWELGLLDQFFRWRPVSPVDSRVVIVSIDEPDIQTIGQFPIPDQILTQALQKIDQHQPRLIGLDIYRDLPVEPGHNELTRFLQQTPHIIGIEKAVGTPILPPPALAQTEQIGFADQLFDRDGRVRRTLLSIEPDAETLKLSFPLKLALEYLGAEGITAQPLPHNSSHLQLGKTLLKPLGAYDGGYIRADAGGYQALVNYWGTQEQFTSFSISEVLRGDVPPEAMRDRIVLIGSTASTINDVLLTPYTDQSVGYMAGVTVHANVISMLLQAALEGRSLLHVWPEPLEITWILLWTGSGILVAGRWQRSPQRMMIWVGVGGICLMALSYGLFLMGWWIPVVPAGLGMVLAAVALPVTTARQVERMRLKLVIQRLLQVSRSNGAVGKIAIAYFKQAERSENQAYIDSILQTDEA
ncbi:MAG: CHASE2 domain-containing protein [Cyanobacteria bacterium P01_F01_bin.150]